LDGLLKMLDGVSNAVFVPKLVHGAGRKARRLSPILMAFPYTTLSSLDE
jgi:hypothetical protein